MLHNVLQSEMQIQQQMSAQVTHRKAIVRLRKRQLPQPLPSTSAFHTIQTVGKNIDCYFEKPNQQKAVMVDQEVETVRQPTETLVASPSLVLVTIKPKLESSGEDYHTIRSSPSMPLLD